ncbi:MULTISPECIES: ROK family transcriptional regulator [Actinomyces]|uniref:ROK family transcriptional regulator n=1 Tax=Actinomyces TaxID=1654 RepID=UPI0009317A7F|nr:MULTISPECIES: ROK family transcriptional regulator [Actinomyces]
MDYDLHVAVPSLEDQITSYLGENPPASRAELCEALAVSRTTLGRAIAKLVDAHAVISLKGEEKTGAGRPSTLFTSARSCAYSVGIVISRASFAAVLLNRGGDVLIAQSLPATHPINYREALDSIGALLLERAHTRGVITDYVRTIGVGLPVPMGSNISHSPHSPYPSRDSVIDIISRRWKGNILIDTTARLSALSEALWGAGQGYPSILYVRLSNGIGASLVISYRLSGGDFGFTGELGHMRVPDVHTPCACGKEGCLETLASIPALCAQCDVSSLSELARKVSNQDSRTLSILEHAMEAVGACCANAALLINPRAIIVAGELPEAIPEVSDMLAHGLERELIPAMKWNIDVVRAELGPLAAAQAAAYAATTTASSIKKENEGTR